MLTNLKITGNEKFDQPLRLAIFGFGAYFGYKAIKGILTSPTNPNPQPQPNGCNIGTFRQVIIKQNMDEVYQVTAGYNVYNYPNEVNVLLGYDNCELRFADDYFRATYGSGLYSWISGEWDIDGDYNAVEAFLRTNGLGN